MDSLISDLRYAVRTLLRAPGFTAAAVLCFAIGIGANATMFGVVDTLLLRPPAHVVAPERVARVYVRHDEPGLGVFTTPSVSYPDLLDWSEHVPAFEATAGFFNTDVTLDRGIDATQARAMLATPSFFTLLGVRPAVGRFFSEDENGPPHGASVAVLSYGFWQRRFGGDPAALGRDLLVDGERYTVIGVAPRGFSGVELRGADLWLPARAMARGITFMEGNDKVVTRNWQWIEVIGRLRPGATAESAARQATRASKLAVAGTADSSRAGTVLMGGILRDRGPERSASARVSLWLGGVSLAVLLIACANVANLLLARASRRRREIAVRLAIGIGRGRLVRQLIAESLVLALLGGGAALLVAAWGGTLIRTLLLPDIGALDDAVSGRVLAFTAIATAATGLLCGLLPALQTTRPEMAAALKAGAREGTYRRSRTRAALLVAQVALTLVLLVGAGLFARSLRNAVSLDLGYDAERLIAVTMDLGSAGASGRSTEAVFLDMRERVAALPGIESASVGITMPLWMNFSWSLRVPGRDSLPRMRGGYAANAVTPEFFQTTGIAIRRGRALSSGDGRGTAPVAVINEALARIAWPGQNAIGKCFHIAADSLPCFEVVGIAESSFRDELGEDPAPQYWIPLGQTLPDMPKSRLMFVRAKGDPSSQVTAIRRAMHAAAPDLPYANVRPFEDMLDPLLRPWRLGASMFALFGLVALALAVIGLYGVLAYTVSQRTQEIGVRVALGAQARDVLRLVVGEGVRVAAVGIALGAVAAWIGTRALAALLFDVSAHDPAVFVTVALALLGAAIAASWIPAWRASRTDPASALRSE